MAVAGQGPTHLSTILLASLVRCPLDTHKIADVSGLLDKSKVLTKVVVGQETELLPLPAATALLPAPAVPGPQPVAPLKGSDRTAVVPLIALCYGRSGDKGDTANIGIFVRDVRYYPLLHQILTAEVVQQHMAHLAHGKVHRYVLPGIQGWNFLLTKALGGGGLVSLNIDRQGKTYAQQLLELRVTVPLEWAVTVQSRL